MKPNIETLKMELSKANTPEKIKLILDTSVKARDELDDLVNEVTARRDELSEVIELCIDKQQKAHPKTQYDC